MTVRSSSKTERVNRGERALIVQKKKFVFNIVQHHVSPSALFLCNCENEK